MKVAIVGGSGYIGRAIVKALVARGDEVTVLSRSSRQAPIAPGVSSKTYAVDRPADLARQLFGHDAVVNVAGTPVGPRPWTPGRKRAILSSRIDTTRSVVAALALLPAEGRPSVMVNVSGTDRYTNLPGGPATEASPSAGGFLAALCLDWEAEADRAREVGVRVAIVRVGFVLGRGGHILPLLALPFRLFVGGPIGSGRQWMSWIHLDDVAGIFVAALDDPRIDGPVNAVSPEPIREADMAAAIGAALRRPSWFRVPAVLVRLVMREQATLILDSRRIAPARLQELGYHFRWTDLRSAVADALGRR